MKRLLIFLWLLVTLVSFVCSVVFGWVLASIILTVNMLLMVVLCLWQLAGILARD